MRRWARRAGSLRAAALLALGAMACSAASRPGVAAPVRGPDTRGASTRVVRIALAQRQGAVRLTADGPWRIYSSAGEDVALTQAGESWILERDGARVSARREDSRPVSRRESPLVVRPSAADGTITFNGRRWRGELLVSVSDGALLVVNRLPMDDYLKGVVPLEIGTSAEADVAAVEAQAVAARSYAYTHLEGAARAFDMVATVGDQVYGGVNAETRVGNDAVERTSGLVLQYGGRAVNAPYHAACGGTTAEPQDVWRSGAEPYLQRVSDQVPGTARFYCDLAPKHRWTRTFTGDELRATIARYVAKLPGGGAVGTVRDVRVASVTPAGRVATLAVETDGRPLLLRGGEVRDALRSPSGDLLYSTYFSVGVEQGRNGVGLLTLQGGGNGHGVGMCQSGAIGRARAGQDFRTILRTYYPGTTVGPIS